MKKVLVTGGGGYIGRFVVDEFANQGFDVLVADSKYVSKHENVTVVDQDIFSGESDIFEKIGAPDILVHLAWRDGFKHNSDSHIDNLPNHYHFIRDMLDGGLQHLVTMGTIHEVGYHEGAVDQNTPVNPESPYGIAKNTMRQFSELLAAKQDVTFQHIRAYYITGDDARSQSVFGKILEASARGDATFPFVTGDKQYDFIDVKELARQIVAVASQGEVNGIINCCSGVPMRLADRVEQFITENNLNIKLEYGVFPDRPYESPVVYGDATKVEKILSRETA